MNRHIRKVAVIGSGIMGSRIACHFANIGCEVVLLDIIPNELNESEKQRGISVEDKKFRNRIVNETLYNSDVLRQRGYLYLNLIHFYSSSLNRLK